MLFVVSRVAAGLGVLLLLMMMVVVVLIHAPAPTASSTTPCIRIAVAVLIIVALAGVVAVTGHVTCAALTSPSIRAAPSVHLISPPVSDVGVSVRCNGWMEVDGSGWMGGGEREGERGSVLEPTRLRQGVAHLCSSLPEFIVVNV